MFYKYEIVSHYTVGKFLSWSIIISLNYKKLQKKKNYEL